MVEARARVLSVDGTVAYVEAVNSAGCGSCGSHKGCGISTLSQMFGGKVRAFQVRNTVGAKPGDSVIVGVEEGALLKSSLIMYLFPLTLLFVGALVGAMQAPLAGMQDETSIWGGAIGLTFGFIGVKLYSRHFAASGRFQPVILRRNNETFCTVIQEH